MHHITKTYGGGASAADRAKLCTVVLNTVRIILRSLIKVRLEAETACGSENSSVIVVQYLCGKSQACIVMD